MRMFTRTALVLLLGAVFFVSRSAARVPDGEAHGKTENHPAVGSYFGKAVQLCPTGAPCGIALFMTPTITGDGIFIGNDSLTLGGAPFGPHTTAHGQWTPTSKTGFIADYTFMLPSPPPGSPDVTALRFRWLANVIDNNTIVGYVNIHNVFGPPVPVDWEPLTPDQPGAPFSGGFPTLPPAANAVVTSPTGVVTDPNSCPNPFAGCPLVFKFTVKRVAP